VLPYAGIQQIQFFFCTVPGYYFKYRTFMKIA